jgi:transposase-like protein
MMDTYTQVVTPQRQYRGLAEKRRIVEETLAEEASVALVAGAHGVNANLVFNWRRLYQAGRLGRRGEANWQLADILSRMLDAENLPF